MGYNKKALSKIKADLNSAKAPSKPRDIIVDPRGQWEHPGQPTRIPGGDITMQGVSYPVMAYPNVGQPQMMYPNQDYQFPGAEYVDEYPQMKRGGSKKFTRDITATNILFTKNPYLKKRKKRKNRVYSPTAPYFQSGGYLPKAQKGLLNLRDAKVEVVPFSYNYSNPQGQTIWGKPYPQEPTYRVGVEAPIKKPKEGYHTLNLDLGLPYSGKLKPSTELRYDWYGKPTLGSENIQLPYVQMTGRGGYDPVEKGFAGMSARTYYGFGTARPQTKSRPAQFGKNDWWSTLGPAFDFNLGDMQTIKNSEFRGNGKRFILDPEWAYGVRGDIEYRPGKDKNFRIGSRYGIMFDPIEGKNMEMLGYKSNSDDGMQFSVNPQLEVYGNYNVDLEPNFKKRASGKLTETAKTTGTTTQNKNTGNTVVIDGIPVEVQNTKENSEPCPEGYRRDRPGGKCVPIKAKTKGPCPPGYTRKYFWEECYREKAHHPRWLKEGGKLGPIPLNSGRKVLRDWTYGESIGMLQEDDGGYIETELTPEEIQAYRDGGYVVEEVDEFRKGGSKKKKAPLDYKGPEEIYTSPEEAFPMPETSKIESLVKPIDLSKMTPEELERYNQDEIIRENKIREETKFNADKIAQPQYFNEGIQWIKDWHNSPMYNQMVLNSFKGDKEKADYLTKLRKENIESIPALNVREEEGNETAAGFKPAGWSNNDTGLIEIFPGGYNYGPSIYVHEGLHSSDRPRGLYKYDDPAYQTGKSPDYFYNKGTDLGNSWTTDAKGNVVDYPDWMIYNDPRFPKEDVVWYDRVMPPSDQMSITTKRGSNWKDNQAYKIAMEKGLYNPRGEDYWKNIMINNWGTDPNDPTFNQQLNEAVNYEKELLQEDLKDAPKKWKQFAHGYVSTPTEVRARLGEIRFNAQKEGIYDPFTEKVTPEIFQNYINKKRENDNWQPMKSLDELRDDFQDEEILWMLNNISKRPDDDNQLLDKTQKGGSIETELTPEEIEWYRSQGYEVEELD